MSGAGRAAAALLVSTALLGCAARRSADSWPAPASGSYSASVRGSLTWHGRGVPISGGCAVDPSRGVRLEARDAFGATRLLLLLSPTSARLVSPSEGLSFSWEEASQGAPWSPRDLWLLFTGRPPVPDVSLTATGRGATETARWRNGAGRLKALLAPSAQGPAPFDSAALEGPGSAELRLSFSRARTSTFADETFSPPAGLSLSPAALGELLAGAGR